MAPASGILIATPVSDLFDESAARERIIDLSDLLELRLPGQAAWAGGPVICHPDVNIVVPWTARERDMLQALADEADVRTVSMHASTRYTENRLEGGAFVGVGEPLSEERMLENAVDNALFVRRAFGPDTELLIENNNDLGTDAYRRVTDPDFLVGLIEAVEGALLLDTAHAMITSHNRKRNAEEYIRELNPEMRCRQLHLSRHGVNNGRAYDAHQALTGEEWGFFSRWLPKLPHLRYVTIEYYKDVDMLTGQLLELRRILSANGAGHE